VLGAQLLGTSIRSIDRASVRAKDTYAALPIVTITGHGNPGSALCWKLAKNQVVHVPSDAVTSTIAATRWWRDQLVNR